MLGVDNTTTMIAVASATAVITALGAALFAACQRTRLNKVIKHYNDFMELAQNRIDDVEEAADKAAAAVATLEEHTKNAFVEIAGEARTALIQSTDTRDKALPLIFAKLKIKAEGGTVH